MPSFFLFTLGLALIVVGTASWLYLFYKVATFTVAYLNRMLGRFGITIGF